MEAYKKLLLATMIAGLVGCGSSESSTTVVDNGGDTVVDDGSDNSGDDSSGDIEEQTTEFEIYYKDDALTGSLVGSTFVADSETTTYSTFSVDADGNWTYTVPELEALGDMDSDDTVVESFDVSIDGETVTLTFTILSADAKPDDEEGGDDVDEGDDEEVEDAYTCADAMDVTGSDSAPVVTGTTYEIDADDLSATLASAVGGDEIVITSGDSISIKDTCFDSQVLIRAETVGGVTLETAAITRSQNITLQGFVFGPNDSSTLLKIANSKNIKVLRNTFDHLDIADGQSSVVMTESSEKITVAYNEFLDKNVITENVDEDDGSYSIGNSGSYIKFQYDDDTETMTKEAHIHHNYFKNIEAYVPTGESTPAGDSDREAIVFGDSGSQDIETFHVIEYNLFEDCDGENEIMTVKTSSNTFNNNTFLNSMGSLSFRLGFGNTAENNYFYGTDEADDAATAYFYGSDVEKVANYQTGGVRIYGENHIVRGNYMENLSGDTWRLPILVDSGDVSDSSNGNSHQATTNATIEDNVLVNNLNGGIQVGGSKYTIMPSSNSLTDNIVIGDTGNLYFSYAAGSANTWSGNIAYATDSAVALDGADAGVGITLTSDELTEATSEPTYSKPAMLTTEDVGPTADL